ncbi:MAG TPA: 16S rRNA (guanine(966)-N(2))-methyltransferase RsmD [Candidatus Limnocylindrales bacterium]|nr:16S rRNA (guanine(966)-N(2))-methyltransferase RsmD [Candidatus Limnocylindrales bacterium]
MRVIAGTARGLRLDAPRDKKIRPITDRVKETLFGILGERVVDARVLDLYAGSGAIGIEALSRGAAHATFVEQSRDAVAIIRDNLRRTHLDDVADVRGTEVGRFLSGSDAGGPYALALLDPPYDERAILAPLERLVPLLAPGATVVVKHFWRTAVPVLEGLHPWRERRFGETALTFLEVP